MEYFLIFILQLFGIGFHVVQKVKQLDVEHPEANVKQIFGIFVEQDWATLFGSGLVMFFHLTTHYIINTYAPHMRDAKINLGIFVIPYIMASFVAAFGLGYFGQRIIYKFFGKAESYLGDKIDKSGK